ncbi:MAG: D-tyrosyl-tRNA(Tyr) deacylase [Desulfobacteraceae bacterium]|nr:MAG: D-tyrosyl-tRNA(Tyr) deacylase [Desulfobacteraceae bacterium]
MKAVIQRVKQSSVTVDGKIVGSIQRGMLILLGVSQEDRESDADYLADKIANLRIFEDAAGKMNLSLLDTGGQALVVSQFTLLGDCRKGRRPSFINAAPPEKANHLYEYFTQKLRDKGIPVQAGIFRAMMDVSLVNDGPVTLILESV